MPISSDYQNLFRTATTAEKLALFETLMERGEELTADLALALLKSIHQELISNQNINYLTYKHYAGIIAVMRHQQSDMLAKVVDAWNAGKTIKEIDQLFTDEVE